MIKGLSVRAICTMAMATGSCLAGRLGEIEIKVDNLYRVRSIGVSE